MVQRNILLTKGVNLAIYQSGTEVLKKQDIGQKYCRKVIITRYACDTLSHELEMLVDWTALMESAILVLVILYTGCMTFKTAIYTVLSMLLVLS